MRKTIDEPHVAKHGISSQDWTRSMMEGSRRDILVSLPKYRVGDLGETVAHDGKKEKWFRS